MSRSVVVVGGGLAGLTAARAMAARGDEVTVLEAAPAVGGKLRAAEVAGVTVDVGAEAMLARRPEGVALAEAAELQVVHPTSARAQVWSRGRLRPLPPTLMGAPTDADALASSGILSEAGLHRALAEVVSAPEGDVSVGDLVDARFGPEVTDRLVDPLLGGVYAGAARDLSAAATVPALVAAATRGPLLGSAVAPTQHATAREPVFGGVEGGMWKLAVRLAEDIDVRTGVTVRELDRTPTGFRLVTGSAASPSVIEADGVVVATPAAASARLLADVSPAAATELAVVESASLAVVTLALPDESASTLPVDASGFLVPPVEDLAIKAATFSFAKWEWTGRAGSEAGVVVLRASVGRFGEETTLHVDDAALVDAVRRDLARVTGCDTPPVDSHVQRWGGALPQYRSGHVDRVRRVRDAVARVPGLAVCGAAYDGVGIPAVIASAHAAVDHLTGTMET